MFDVDTKAIADMIQRVVQQEGPIHKLEAARRVAANWQISRVGHRVQARIEWIAQSGCPPIAVRGDFFWPKNMQEPQVRIPAPGDEARPIELIAVEEIQQAAQVVLRRNFGMSKEDLIHETAKLLGHSRTGDIVHSRIKSGIDRLIRRGILHESSGRLTT